MNRLQETYNEFSPKFWILVLSSFIDRLGGDNGVSVFLAVHHI